MLKVHDIINTQFGVANIGCMIIISPVIKPDKFAKIIIKPCVNKL